MRHICKNCQNQFEGNYCNLCGQQAEIKKIDFRFIRYDLQQGLFNFDTGILYTIKELFSRPGHSIREFLEGKRIHHFKPISLVLILATVYAFVHHYFGLNLFRQSGDSSKIAESANRFYELFEDNYSLIVLFTIPFLSLSSFLLFRRQGYNYFEHVVVNSFLTSQRFVANLVIFPLQYLFGFDYERNVAAVLVVSMTLCSWVFVQLFNQMKAWVVIFRSLLSFSLGIIVFLIVFLIFLLLMVLFV